MRRLLLVISLAMIVACSPTKVCLDEECAVAQSGYLVVNGDLSQGPNWVRIPGSGTWFSKINSGLTSPTDSTRLYAKGPGGQGVFQEFSCQDAPGDLDTLTELEYRVRARWLWDGLDETPSPFNLDIGFFVPGWGAIDSRVIDLQAQAETSYRTYGPYVVTGLSLTKAQADAITCELTAGLPTTPGGHPNVGDVIEISELDFRLTYTIAAVTSTPQRKMHIGLGFGPGRR